jgi:hypothetical protein
MNDKLNDIAKKAALELYGTSHGTGSLDRPIEIITRACEEAYAYARTFDGDIVRQQLAESELNRKAYEDEITRLKEHLDDAARELADYKKDEADWKRIWETSSK